MPVPRRRARRGPGRAEALAIATEFAPSVLVARLLGVAEFALGSTMVFRAETCGRSVASRRSRGLSGRRLPTRPAHRAAGLRRIEFAPVVVETSLGGESWGEVWRHQLRWSRTIRVSRTAGYYGYVVTHATLWSLVAFAARDVVGRRHGPGVSHAGRCCRGRSDTQGSSRDAYFWLIPLRDLFGFAVWICGAFGNEVIWRGHRLGLRPDGRIC